MKGTDNKHCPDCKYHLWESGIVQLGCTKLIGGINAIYGLDQLPYPDDCPGFEYISNKNYLRLLYPLKKSEWWWKEEQNEYDAN
jgi:hypothetical protein